MDEQKSQGISVFDRKSLKDIINEIQSIYLEYPQPWVIGYSGGKDSTTVLQLVVHMYMHLLLTGQLMMYGLFCFRLIPNIESKLFH